MPWRVVESSEASVTPTEGSEPGLGIERIDSNGAEAQSSLMVVAGSHEGFKKGRGRSRWAGKWSGDENEQQDYKSRNDHTHPLACRSMVDMF